MVLPLWITNKSFMLHPLQYLSIKMVRCVR